MTTRTKLMALACLVAAVLLFFFAGPASAQTHVLDAGDSIVIRAAQVAPDTVPMPLPSGTDTTRYGLDSTRLAWWHTGRIDDSTRLVIHPVLVRGLPLGATSAWASTSTLKPNQTPLTASMDGVTPGNILARITAARNAGHRLLLNMTGGSHSNYLTNGVFDRAKWNTRMDGYNTPAIRQAVADAVADGTIIGNSVMDEPHVSGAGDGNTWGPAGTMTKVRVDSLCRYTKQMFPTLPVGVTHQHRAFESSRDYRTCEFLVSQYSHRLGDIAAWRDAELAGIRRQGMRVYFSINILNGGVQDRVGAWDCPGVGKGTYTPNCRMTAAQVRTYGLALIGPACGLNMWRYDDTFFARTDNQGAFTMLADSLAALPRVGCGR